MQVCNEIERENYPPAGNNAGDALVEKVNYPEMLYMSYISLWLLCILICGKFFKLPRYIRSEGKHPGTESKMSVLICRDIEKQFIITLFWSFLLFFPNDLKILLALSIWDPWRLICSACEWWNSGQIIGVSRKKLATVKMVCSDTLSLSSQAYHEEEIHSFSSHP